MSASEKETLKHIIKERFDRAKNYDRHAVVQRLSARRLIECMCKQTCYFEMKKELFILEIGCGTGFLTQQILEKFPQGRVIATDLSPAMIAQAKEKCKLYADRVHFVVMDAERISFNESFDIICSNFALQWMTPYKTTLRNMAQWLKPGGIFFGATMAKESFAEWAAACSSAGIACGTPLYPTAEEWRSFLPAHGHGVWRSYTIVAPVANGLSFLQDLKAIGAATPQTGYKKASMRGLKKALSLFDEQFQAITYSVALGWYRVPPVKGVFVTGTDTGVGKTFISTLLARTWKGSYWKPLQTGLADEPSDASIVHSAHSSSDIAIIPGLWALQKSLSPKAALGYEGKRPPALTVHDLTLSQNTPQPVIIEGAGGVAVPVDDGVDMMDVMLKTGVPVIIVARSGLGTVNHTLLTLSALRAKGISILGVVMNGPLTPHNKAAIEEEGGIQVIAEIPWHDHQPVDFAPLYDKVPAFTRLWEDEWPAGE